MTQHNPNNERIKRQYFAYLREAKRQSDSSIDGVAAALARFEEYNRYRDFKTFHFQQAVAFKHHLADRHSQATGGKLSKATQYATLSHLRRFFGWLAWQPGYRSRFRCSDADYFNFSDKDSRIATARRTGPVPTLEQIRHVVSIMPSGSPIEKRNRALVAFTILTGARDGAIASLKVKHVDLASGCVHQDAREVNTKNSKTFTICFFPIDGMREIVTDWLLFLRTEMLWGDDDPLFPRTKVAPNSNNAFEAAGLERAHWSNATPIRNIFRQAFTQAGLPYFWPHSFRKTLGTLGEKSCGTPEEFKAWSQNLGHEGVLTTLYSYGTVPFERQREIIGGLGSTHTQDHDATTRALLRALLGKLESGTPSR